MILIRMQPPVETTTPAAFAGDFANGMIAKVIKSLRDTSFGASFAKALNMVVT